MPRPTCMSADVTSMPSLTRSGRPSASLRSSSPSGRTWTAFRVSSVSNVLEILDLDRLQLVRRLEAEDLREEGEVRLERPLHVRRLTEAVALSLEGDVRVRDTALSERLDDHLGLCRRHDLVVEPLQQQQGSGERVGLVDGRAFAIGGDRLGTRADEVVVVVRLELVRVLVEGDEISDAVVRRPSRELVADREREQRRVAARAAALDLDTGRIDVAVFREIAHCRCTVLDVDFA